jgi:uncharacterized membrane protein (DUF373 family)
MPESENGIESLRRPASRLRTVVARIFMWVEDAVYIGLGALLAASAVALLVQTALTFSSDLFHGSMPTGIVALLDRLLLVLMIIELLYTVQVSFREHTLVPEPFLIVGLVAATRRILVLTAAFAGGEGLTEFTFRVTMTELAILTVMIVALVGSLLMLRRHYPEAKTRRS